MQILIPQSFKGLKLTDRQAIFIDLMYRMRKEFPTYKLFRMYSLDIKTILGDSDKITSGPLMEPFNGLITCTDIDHQTWYVQINWDGRDRTFKRTLTDPKAIQVFCYLLGRTSGNNFEDRNPKTFSKYTVKGGKGIVANAPLTDWQRRQFVWVI